MATERIVIERVLNRLDAYFSKNDYVGAERHLKYWLDEAVSLCDRSAMLLLCNELIGLSRKVGKQEQAFKFSSRALGLLAEMDIERSSGAGTTYINVGTAYKAFGRAEESLAFFDKALEIYSVELAPNDPRMGGLYNNMALSLADTKRFKEAYEYFDKAIEVMTLAPSGELDVAITYLNIASTLDAQKGFVEAEDEIFSNLDRAAELLDKHAQNDDGYYAFVCEKCASVFGYYGRFAYEKTLKERAVKIYEGT